MLAREVFDRLNGDVPAGLLCEQVGGNDRTLRIVWCDGEGAAQVRDDHVVIVVCGEFGAGCDQQGDAVFYVGSYRREPGALQLRAGSTRSGVVTMSGCHRGGRWR